MLNFFRRSYDCDVLFVSTASIDEVWIRSTAIQCKNKGLQVIVASCDNNKQSHDELKNRYRPLGIKTVLGKPLHKVAKISARAVVTASSDLGKDIFPTKTLLYIHMPHSLASLHMVYPEGAFDDYDILFAVGPHQITEYDLICQSRNLHKRRAFPIGYGKLDILRLYDKRATDQEHIFLAPSWGPDNLLDRCGIALIQKLSALGKKVTIRPHPLFFLENPPILNELVMLAESLPHVNIENSLSGDGAILDAGIMIGDYSGTSFEFAALRQLPVISVNVGKKITNANWESLGITPIEIGFRNKLGPVVEPDISAIINAVESKPAIVAKESISTFVFDDSDSCGERATKKIMELLK